MGRGSPGVCGCISVLVGRRKLVVPSPPARVGNLAQACTDRQTANAPGRRRVAGHGFSRGTANPPPRPLPPRARSRFRPRRPDRGGRGRGGGRRKPPLKRWPVTRPEHGNRSAPWGWAEQARPEGFHQNADATHRLRGDWGLPCGHANPSPLAGGGRFVTRRNHFGAQASSPRFAPEIIEPAAGRMYRLAVPDRSNGRYKAYETRNRADRRRRVNSCSPKKRLRLEPWQVPIPIRRTLSGQRIGR